MTDILRWNCRRRGCEVSKTLATRISKWESFGKTVPKWVWFDVGKVLVKESKPC